MLALIIWISFATKGVFRLKSIAADGQAKDCFSLYCAIFALIVCLGHGSLIGWLLAYHAWLYLAGAVCSAGGFLCFALWTLRLRSALRKVSKASEA